MPPGVRANGRVAAPSNLVVSSCIGEAARNYNENGLQPETLAISPDLATTQLPDVAQLELKTCYDHCKGGLGLSQSESHPNPRLRPQRIVLLCAGGILLASGLFGVLASGGALSGESWDDEILVYGEMRQVLGLGRHEGRIRVGDLAKRPHCYAVGALAQLAGEVTSGRVILQKVRQLVRLAPAAELQPVGR